MDKFICQRAKMGYCKDHECYHNEPHTPVCKDGSDHLCTSIEQCDPKMIQTRCVKA